MRSGARQTPARRHPLPNPDLTATRGISISATPSEVWPWLAQLGQNRGGFYTYDWVENLAGVEIHSVDAVEPELQIRSVGDDVNLAPEVVLSVVLQPRTDGSTRLVVRERYAYLTDWAKVLVEPIEMVSFLMTERMLRGIRDRAEHSPSRTTLRSPKHR